MVRGRFARYFGVDPLFKDDVPAPWIPLEWDEESHALTCWGRTYTFDGMFPTSIISKGAEILAAPVELQAVVDGERVEYTGLASELAECTPGFVSFGVECGLGSLHLSAQISVEFDGMMRFDVQVQADNPVHIDSLYLVVPLKRETVTLYHHHPVKPIWEWNWAVDPMNAGALPPEGLKLPYTYHIWLGDDDRGLQWFAESDEGYEPADPSQVISVVPEGDACVLRIDMMSGCVLEGAFRFTFGLMASPVRPMPSDYHSWCYNHQAHWSMAEHRYSSHPLKDGLPADKDHASWLDELQSAGARYLGFHEWWADLQSLPIPVYPDRFHSLLDAVHERGMKLIPYTGVYMSEIAPEFDPDWNVGPADKIWVYNRSAYEDRNPPQRASVTCWNTPYPSILTEGYAKLFEEYDLDGIYTDGLVVPLPCTNMKHGCGYFDQEGNVRPTVALFAAREMMKRFYQICREQDKETLIVSHTSASIVLPVLAFSDAYLDGEHLLSKKRAGTVDLSLEALRAEMCGHNYGIPAFVLPSNDPLYGRDYPRGIALLLDVTMPWDIADEIDIWRAYKSFGVDGAEWIPYWRSDSLITYTGDNVLISSYLKRGQGLLMVAMNLSGQNSVGRVTLDADKSGMNGALTARDAVTDEPLVVDNGTVSFGIGPGTFRMVAVELYT